MALHDWNHDGKKDLTNDYIEYQIYKQSTSGNKMDNRRSAGNGGGEDTPVFLIIVLWVICSAVLSAWLG